MKSIFNAIVAPFTVFYLLTLTGCVTPLPSPPEQRSTEHRYKKNYTLGAIASANVGEPLIAVQDFFLTTIQTNLVTPTGDIDVRVGGASGSFGGPTWVFIRDNPYEIEGEKELDGIKYTVAATKDLIPQASTNRNTIKVKDGINWAGLLIKDDGTIDSSRMVWSVNGHPIVKPANISNPKVTFLRQRVQRVEEHVNQYVNYEIIYTGVNASGINLTYREFSPDGLARVAFYQNLTYELGAKIIGFKNFKITIESATSEKLVYKVTEDALPKN